MVIKARFGYLTRTLASMLFKIFWLRLQWHRWTRELHNEWHLKGWPPIKNAPGMELIPDQKKQRTCIIATTTPESFETHGFDMPNHKSLHRRHGRRAKITSGQTRLSKRAGTPLILMELQDLDLRPNLMQDDTPTPPTLSRMTTTKRSVLSSPIPTTLTSTSRIRKQNMHNSWKSNKNGTRTTPLQYKS